MAFWGSPVPQKDHARQACAAALENELLDFANGAPAYHDLLPHLAEALCAYRSQCWYQAIEKLEQLLVAYPDDGPSKEFLRRCHEYLDHSPAADWYGVYVWKQSEFPLVPFVEVLLPGPVYTFVIPNLVPSLCFRGRRIAANYEPRAGSQIGQRSRD